MDRKEKFTKAIELYTGEKVESLDLFEDPSVRDTWAIRCQFAGKEVFFLLVGQELVGGTRDALMEDIAEFLEEVQFTAWPPHTHRTCFERRD